MSASIWQVILFVPLLVSTIWIYGRILNKAGYSRWWVLVVFVPILNFIMIWVFAFAKWPLLKETKKNIELPNRDMNGWLRLWVLVSVAWVSLAVTLAALDQDDFHIWFFFGLLPPLILLLLGCGIAWVRRGFGSRK